MINRRFFVFLILVVFATAKTISSEDIDRLEKALELYEEGSSQSQKIISLLTEELKENPENEGAIRLLGITYFGTGNFEQALKQFNAAIAAGEKRERILPSILFLKARTLYHLNRREESRHILEVYSAFWQADETLAKDYEALNAKLNEKMEQETAAKGASARYEYALAGTATNIIQQFQDGSLAGFFVIAIGQEDYVRFQKDKDLEPFIGVASCMDIDLLIIVMPPRLEDNLIHCVFFNDSKAVSRVSVPYSSVSSSDSKQEIQRHLISIESENETMEGMEELYFQDITLQADDGTPLEVQRILSAGQK